MKRTLVIANACFSDVGANGRTLKNLFVDTDAGKLAQFFVYGEPDFSVCQKYYQVSDKDALQSLLFPKKAGTLIKEEKLEKYKETNTEGKNEKKTPVKALGREMVWRLGRWRTKRLWEWMDAFEPEIIVLFIANSAFLIRLTREIEKRYQIPVIVYSTEGYNFMDYNYFTRRFSLIYYIYYAWLCREYKKLAQFVKQGFFNTTLLRDKYALEYGYPCSCAMNKSQIDWIEHSEIESEEIRITYLGNLGLGRHKALIEVAEVLQKIDQKLYLDIYGVASDELIKKELEENAGIRFRGFISYDKVKEVIHKSNLLVHAELNDAMTNRDLKYAFSTKIADCVCSGTPLLIYANEGLAETVFLKENDCAFIAHDKEGLKEILKQALTDQNTRRRILQNARITRDKFLTGKHDEFMEALTR